MDDIFDNLYVSKAPPIGRGLRFKLYVLSSANCGKTLKTYYSTVTLLARFLGWSTSLPRSTAMW